MSTSSCSAAPLRHSVAALGVLPAEVTALAIGHRVFGSSFHREPAPGLVTERFTRCVAADHPEGRWFKTVVPAGAVAEYDSVHSVRLKRGAYLRADMRPLVRTGSHPGCADRPILGAFGLHHYRIKSLAEFRDKQRRWRGRGHDFRYADGYFSEVDRDANAVENVELHRFLPALRSMLRHLGVATE